MTLFVQDPRLVFEKSAAVELEEDPTAWPRQVLTELYRVLPEIADYTPEVNFLRVDEEQGYALGVVVVTGSTNSALAADSAGETPSKKALLPVVVKGHRLLPIDVIISTNGKMYPLTAERLREVLFRPETFDLMTDEWNNTSLWNMFFPPGRSNNTYGSGVSGGLGGAAGGVSVMTGPGMKLSSAGFAMLEALRGTMLEPDITSIAQALDNTPGLLKAAGANAPMLEALRLLSTMPCVTADAVEHSKVAVAECYPAQVVQMGWSENTERYWVKTANRDAATTQLSYMGRGEFLKFAGDELTSRVDTEGTITVSEKDPEVVVLEGPSGRALKVCDASGYYSVYTAQRGKSLSGWVIPGLLDASGHKVPVTLFTNGVVSTTQEQIAVDPDRSGCERHDLPCVAPKGHGCFWFRTAGYGDSLRATVPVEVKGATRNEDGSTTYICTDFTGMDCKITLSMGARGAVALPKAHELILPHGAGFVALGAPVALVSTGAPQESNKLAALEGRISVAAHGDETYSLRFSAGVQKLAAISPVGTCGHDDAVFALCVGGLGAQGAHDALAYADTHGHVQVPARDLGGIDYSGAYKTAAARVEQIHALRHNLVKEAAALPDAMTVDSVLSLGFINAENAQIFVARIPYLERALTMVCELLLASRVGLTEIPEGAAARCARALNDTIQGLKSLALREINDVA